MTKKKAVRGLCEATIHTTISANLTLHQMTTEQGHHAYEQPRIIQAKAAKNMLGTSRRVSPQIILMELGWTPIDADIIGAKLRLFEQLKMQPIESYQKHIVTARMEQVLQGCTKGLCYEALRLWEEIGLPEQFTDIQDKKLGQRKRGLIQAGAETLAKEWQEEWLEDHGAERNGYYGLLYQGKRARHLKNGTRTQKALMTTARAGASILRGTKAADKQATKEDRQCQDCGLHKTENEQHLLIECTYEPWKKLREQCRETIKQAWKVTYDISRNVVISDLE